MSSHANYHIKKKKKLTHVRCEEEEDNAEHHDLYSDFVEGLFKKQKEAHQCEVMFEKN